MPHIDRKIFFDGIRSGPFPGTLNAGQVKGCTAILDEWDRRSLTDRRFLAYMLATVKWETDHTMQPIKENGSAAYLRSKRYFPWVGRGYVQLTWKANYQKFRGRVLKQFSVDLIAMPDNALRPDVAAFVMFEGMITGEFSVDKRDGKAAKLAKYFNATTTDWINARRIINGTDEALTIAGIAKQFYSDLQQA